MKFILSGDNRLQEVCNRHGLVMDLPVCLMLCSDGPVLNVVW